MVARTWMAVVPSSLLVLAACGGSGPMSLFDGGGGGADAGTRDAAGDAGPRKDTGSDAPHLDLDSGEGGGGGDAACATDHAKASPVPVDLLFLMDRSDSMKQDSKWTSCSSALTTFFTTTTAVSLSASLTFFPFVPSGKGAKASCVPSDYETPVVPLTGLPSSAFTTVIADETLFNGTPTLPALTGGFDYAQTVQAAHSGDKVVLVLATDGQPVGCTGNDITTVSAEAATAYAAGIPTYVIGVGSSLKNLNDIAAAGGTGSAFLVDVGDAGSTTAMFEAAIESIQSSLGCDYKIPKPGGGSQEIDYDKVNVELTEGGKTTELPYSADCSDTSGWHYDDRAKPTKIILCSASCAEAKSGDMGSMDILFGCNTIGAK